MRSQKTRVSHTVNIQIDEAFSGEARPKLLRETARAAGWCKLLLVTDPLHLARAAALARGLGLDVALSGAAAAPPPTGTVAWLLRAIREGYLLHWYHVGLAYSRAIGSSRLLGRVT